METFVGFFEGGRSAGTDVGEQTDFGDARAEFVVKVASEPGTFGFKETLTFGAFALFDFLFEFAGASFDFAAETDHPTGAQEKRADERSDDSEGAFGSPPGRAFEDFDVCGRVQQEFGGIGFDAGDTIFAVARVNTAEAETRTDWQRRNVALLAFEARDEAAGRGLKIKNDFAAIGANAEKA